MNNVQREYASISFCYYYYIHNYFLKGWGKLDKDNIMWPYKSIWAGHNLP